MFRNDESRALFAGSLALASLLFAAVGTWLLGGWLASGAIVVATLLNILAVGYVPNIPSYFGNGDFVGLGVVVTVLALVFGIVAFGWTFWVYLAAALVIYLVSSAFAKR